MAGGPAHILPGAVAPIGPWSASKIQMKILCSFPKFTSRIRPQNPPQNRLFAPKTQKAVWVRPLQTKIMCKPPPPMDGTNSGSSALEGRIKFAFEAVNAVVKIVGEGKFRLVCEEVALFLLRLLLGFKRFKEELEELQCFLDKNESKQNAVEGSEDIRDQVSFEIRDVIDDIDIFSETTQRRRLGVVGRVQRFISLQLITRIIVACKILKITLKIRGIFIFTKREFYGISREIKEGRQKASSSIQSLQDRWRSSAEKEEPEEVVGLEEEIKTVTEQLINGEESRAVISITGMGGSGKTTLAKKVYHDVKDAFECHALICLSQQFKIEDVIMRMIKDVMGLSREAIEKLNEEELRGMLCDHLTKKKYLVVFDDVRSMKAWHMLQLVLPDGKDKSRVMLTTRDTNVALYADRSSPPVKMPDLVGDEGWELFMKKIFPKEKNPSTACPSELEEIGKKILEKCGGLPLVILTIGGLLARKERTLHAWSKVLNSVDRRLTKGPFLDSVHVHPTEDPKWCMEILALSYWDLPYYLKPCFLYFGLFPEDYEIDPAKLIRLWIAEGFIQQRNHEIIEDEAEDYLEELILRNMIQASWKRHDGSVGGCRIHDLFRKLAILKAGKNNFFTIHNVEGTDQSLPNNIRRLALHRSINGYHPTSTLRSILDFCGTIDISGSEFRQAKFLRVIMHHPKATLIKELKGFVHLRYLELAGSSESLPSSSLEDLDNLQTLVLKFFYGSLPDAISNLKQLRHLDADFSKVGNLRVKDLTNLQTLSLRPGKWIKDGFGNLTNLRNLTIFGARSLNDETLSDSIEKLHSLRSLKLVGGSDLPQLMPFTNHVLLYKMTLYGTREKLPELPPNLIELTLCDSWLEQDDISKLEKLKSLKILELSYISCESEKMICTKGGFPRLEILKLKCMPSEEWIIEGLPLEEWIEEGAMPSLKNVELSSMLQLNTTLPERVRVLLKQLQERRDAEHK